MHFESIHIPDYEAYKVTSFVYAPDGTKVVYGGRCAVEIYIKNNFGLVHYKTIYHSMWRRVTQWKVSSRDILLVYCQRSKNLQEKSDSSIIKAPRNFLFRGRGLEEGFGVGYLKLNSLLEVRRPCWHLINISDYNNPSLIRKFRRLPEKYIRDFEGVTL